MPDCSDTYWNHNAAYHPWLVNIAERHSGDVLDVGCGEGLLAQRLLPVSRTVTAIDPDASAVQRAHARLGNHPQVVLSQSSFDAFDAGSRRFDLITFVASLHHMELRSTLVKARQLLTATGEIAVVGLSANRSLVDWLISAAYVPAVRLASMRHAERRDISVAVANPRESLSEIRRTAGDVLPGVQIRRGLYYRYLLRWTSSEVIG
ncbi:SAM-dependent methyltransferase [Mycobacterium sp. CBMA 234]|uniref:class I SAM-dependent methyltransferase n=1 Tax=Mycolicibacterium sp. CBMA 234 TaxID=1918495 RepID=UPI0028155B5E|nr:class I SAM-dependent methyltransferase [Mycolicibacterium sp. CBMA 234]MUL64127.1 SAM-dependent methyltransferase [Mycolicibacterium sp. CBMA 234]